MIADPKTKWHDLLDVALTKDGSAFLPEFVRLVMNELVPAQLELIEPEKKQERPRNVLHDALATACGCDPMKMTKREHAACAVALAEIRKVMPELTTQELERRAQNFRMLWRGRAPTPSQLCANWSACEHAQQTQQAPVAQRPLVSLYALQTEEARIKGELRDILYPGGCQYQVEPTGEKLARYNELRDRLESVREKIAEAA